MNYLGTISYLGPSYHGFQRQSRLPSVQGKIEEILSSLLSEKIMIKGAGRTDAGVHAYGQTFSFSTKKISNLDKIIRGFNLLCPNDMSLLSLVEVEDSFDARHSCIGKIYRYDFYWGKKNPFKGGRACFLPVDHLDLDALKDCLNLFEGTHDFSSFTTKKEDIDGFIRTLKRPEIHIDEAKEEGFVIFQGNGFMTYQIRMMMGSAFKVAMHRCDLSFIANHLEHPSPRHILPYKAKAEGLYLCEVLYQ